MKLAYCFLALLAPALATAAPQSVFDVRPAQSTLKTSCPCDLCDCGSACRCEGGQCQCATCRIAIVSHQYAGGTWDVLEELNAQRAARGLPAYIWDHELTMAAGRASKWRAERLQFGHCSGSMGDFAHLRNGARADAAGCAAYPASYGFLACACYEPGLHYAGAAYTLGTDGKRYCHLFIRRAAAAPVLAAPALADCPTGSWGVRVRAGRR